MKSKENLTIYSIDYNRSKNNMKKYIYRLWNYFQPFEQPKYGAKIFQQKSWLERQVNEELLKRQYQ